MITISLRFLHYETIFPTDDQLIVLVAEVGLCLSILNFFYNSAFCNSQPGNLFMMLLLGVSTVLARRHKELSGEIRQ